MSEAKLFERIRTVATFLLIGIFIGLIWLPTLDSFFKLDKAPMPNENRSPAKFPSFTPTLHGLKEYMAGIDSYYSDNFGFRKRLVRWHHRWKRQLFKESSMSNVMIGHNGWLFFAGDSMIEYARAVKPFTNADLESWQSLIEGRRNWLAAQKIAYIFVIPPDKTFRFYPEHLPHWITRVNPATRLDQFVAHMKANSDVEILDLRKPLLEAKTVDQTYLFTDTHWNQFGSFVAYQSLIQTLSKQVPDLKPLALDAFEKKLIDQPGGDLAVMLNQSMVEKGYVFFHPKPPLKPLGFITETNLMNKAWVPAMEPVVTRNPEHSRKVIVFRDSFAGGWVPFLGHNFKEVIYLWQYNWDKPFITETKPDIVIDEMLERFLCSMNPTDLARLDATAGATKASHH